MHSLERLPSGLPPPVDDGGSRHLPGMTLPHCRLASTQGDWIDPAAIAGRIVIYCYPMTGRLGVALPDGWDQIPGARGCTPQACAFRDHHAELRALGAQVFGLSIQTGEKNARLHLRRGHGQHIINRFQGGATMNMQWRTPPFLRFDSCPHQHQGVNYPLHGALAQA